jgi:uncharacterized protein (DUF488 family)
VILYSIGHSNHPIDEFLRLLMTAGITAIADVRSRPFSRRNPQFNKNRLAATLAEHGIAYVFLGRELGARSEDPSCYEGGKVQYARLMATALFNSGIERVVAGAGKYRVALRRQSRVRSPFTLKIPRTKKERTRRPALLRPNTLWGVLHVHTAHSTHAAARGAV